MEMTLHLQNGPDTLANIGKKSDVQGDAHDYQYGTDPGPEKLTDVRRQGEYANSVEKLSILLQKNIKR